MKTILVPVDFSDVTGKVVEAAKTLAQAFKSRIVLLHVLEPDPEFARYDPTGAALEIAPPHDPGIDRHNLDVWKARLESSGVEVEAVQTVGLCEDAILHECEERQADLIVVGSHGHGAVYTLLVGSVTAGLLKAARCPVLVVPSAKQ